MQVLEIAILRIKPGMINDFESSFRKASKILSGTKGYISHELQKSIETADKYVLLVRWESLKHHTIGFKQSEEYQEWKSHLDSFYEPLPEEEHFINIKVNS